MVVAPYYGREYRHMQRKNSRFGRGGGFIHPQPFQSSIYLKKRIRFKAVAAATTALAFNDLQDLLCVAATTTSAFRLADAVRIKKIEMWGPMAQDLVPVTVSVDWTGSTSIGGFGKSNRVSDTSMGSTEPAHLVSKPPADTQIAQWVRGNNNLALCSLTYPLGTIIDLSYELVLRDDGTAQAVGGAVAGATVGANYIRSLDSNTGTNLVPVSYSTI